MQKSYMIFLYLCFSCLGIHAQTLTVLFENNKFEISDKNAFEIIKVITTNKLQHIRLEGHCDSIGSKEFNKTLSAKRIQAVKKLLIDNGIAKENIESAIAYGEDNPLYSNKEEQDRMKNRRVLIAFHVGKLLALSENKKNSTEEKENVLKKEKFIVGETIVLKNLLFYGGRHIVKEESKQVLFDLLELLKKQTTMTIEIGGHVCCTNALDGDDFDTRTSTLSVNRAMEIRNFLVHCGIDAKRLQVKGYGSSQKLFPDEKTEEEQQENRRVEVKILEN